MKQKVSYSHFCSLMTVAVIIIFVIGLIVTRDIPDKFNPLAIIFIVMILTALFYAPSSVEVTNESLIVHRPLKNKSLPLHLIKSAETFYPSAGGLRLCGSGGFVGYWGYFSDIMCGSYFGYYGKRDSCFLLRLKDGKQYVVGCENPQEMVNYINTLLQDEINK